MLYAWKPRYVCCFNSRLIKNLGSFKNIKINMGSDSHIKWWRGLFKITTKPYAVEKKNKPKETLYKRLKISNLILRFDTARYIA